MTSMLKVKMLREQGMILSDWRNREMYNCLVFAEGD